MRLFIVSPRRTFEIVDYNPETRVAILRNEAGEEVIDPNFYPEMIKRAGYTLEEREDDA